ncbi:hypothetical protein B0T25DRAFT_513909 [Lasiosphaeria hispida]|uniref:Uncharacterized protein n=1 Tax=Lasiosphaeria hispida TaxID=260671 RepID=A0AAJ0MKR7_9PEZI|nr:hypothetical protein B0T25DRAFT_513909 [Lasiosphaeria hispida]
MEKKWGGKLPEVFHTTHIVNCLKAAYLNQHMFWEKGLAKNKLSWTNLMDQLNTMSKESQKASTLLPLRSRAPEPTIPTPLKAMEQTTTALLSKSSAPSATGIPGRDGST